MNEEETQTAGEQNHKSSERVQVCPNCRSSYISYRCRADIPFAWRCCACGDVFDEVAVIWKEK